MRRWISENRHRYAPLFFLTELVHRYQQHHVSYRSAAMAYYMLFSIFPLLIFFSSLLGRLQISIQGAMALLSPILPDEILELCITYLVYISEESSSALLWFSLVFSLYFPARAARCLMDGVRLAYHIPKKKSNLRSLLRGGVFTVALLLTMTISLVVITFGERLLLQLAGRSQLALYLISLWNSLRFWLLGLWLFFVLCLLYAFSQDHRPKLREVFPGALGSLAAWMVISVGFSYYVENFGRYSLLYGTLGAVIVLLIWLSFSAATLLLGAECNGAAIMWREERERNP